MHKIEQLAEQLSELASQLQVCSSRYVELATALKDGLENTYLTCNLNTQNQTFAVDLCYEDLQPEQFKQVYKTAEKAAQEYAERIGILWSSVHQLAGTVKDTVSTVDDEQPEVAGEVFKVDDDN
jgi:hypothetical protein